MIFSTEIDEKAWHHLVYHHPQGNIHQSPQISRVYRQTKNYQPCVLGMLEERSGEIKGIVSGVIISENLKMFSSLSRRVIVYGGPLVSPDAGSRDISGFMAAFDEMNTKTCAFSEVRNIHDMSAVFQSISHYRFVDHLNYLIDLQQPEDAIWKKINRQRKQNIRRAEQSGVTVEEITHAGKIPVLYHMLEETYRRVHVPLADISLFHSAFHELVPEGFAKFLLAKYEDRYVGALATLLYRDTIYGWYAGIADDASTLYPVSLLVWHILRWGRENGYRTFDFGGAGHPKIPYGVREFKKRFGGEQVNYGRYIHVYSPLRMKFFQAGFRLYQKFFHHIL